MSEEKRYVSATIVTIAEALHALKCMRVELHPDGGVTVCQQFDKPDANYPSVSAWLEEALGSSAKTDKMFELEACCLQAGFDKACVRTGSAEGRDDDLVVSLGGLKVTVKLLNGQPGDIKKSHERSSIGFTN